MNLDDRAVNIFTDGSSLPSPRRGGTGICIVTVDEAGHEVIDHIQPLLSNHFNLTVEMPLKAIVRGHSYAVVPISWTNRAQGVSKLRLQEMGSRYLFIVLYLWLEKHLARGDYHRTAAQSAERTTRQNA